MRLTLNQKRLIAFPPTEETWICQHPREASVWDQEKGGYAKVTIPCNIFNSRRRKTCWLCGMKKEEGKYTLAWPIYQEALEIQEQIRLTERERREAKAKKRERKRNSNGSSTGGDGLALAGGVEWVEGFTWNE